MRRLYVLYLYYPRHRKIGVGSLDVTRDGYAMFFAGDGGPKSKLLAELRRTRLGFVSADGLMLDGMESKGLNKRGREQFAYQEWWLAYQEEA